MPVLVAVGAGGLLVLAAYAGAGVLALAVIGAQVLLAYGLATATALPDGSRAAALVALSGAGAVIALRLAEPEPSGPSIAPALWVVGPAVVLALLLELTRRDGRERLVESLGVALTGVAVAGLLALYVPLGSLEPLRSVGVALAAAGATIGVATWWLATLGAGRWRWVTALAAVATMVAAGLTLAAVEIPELASDQRLVVGAAVGGTAVVGAGAGRQLAASASASATSGAAALARATLMPALGLALCAPAAYLALRVLFW